MSVVSENLASGEARRDAALTLLRAYRSDLIHHCQAVALRVALEQGEVTADDVRGRIVIPEGIGPKFMGAVFRELGQARILRKIGVRNSTRPETHCRPVGIWRIADCDAALAWLAANPPLKTD